MNPATISPKASPRRADSGLKSCGKKAVWVCDRCGVTIDKRKYSFDEAAESGYEKFGCGGACDHAEQTLRHVDN